jgi:23S rRNA pseudouridine2604 synthase
MAQDADNQISLNKLISNTGFCSRREADKLIELGQVTVDGEVVRSKGKVSVDAVVTVDGKPLKSRDKTVYMLFNKPVGVICTTDREIKGNIVDYINYPSRIFPVGRLDKPSEGLIMLTNDGDIVNKILRAGNAHEKEYQVTVDRKITPEFIEKMSNGIPILETVTRKCLVRKESAYVFRLILTEGLNRQIRRMCEYLEYGVTKLKRTRIMNLSLGDLAPGEWRYLSKKEEQSIKSLISDSVKTEDASIAPAAKSQQTNSSSNRKRKSKRNYTTRHRD